MLCPNKEDKQYADYKKLQSKHPGIDILQAQTDAEVNKISINEAIKTAEVQAAKEAEAKKDKVPAK